jgi:hypothetical protein
MIDRSQTKEGRLDPRNYPNDDKLFNDMPPDELEHEREFEQTFATITIGTIVTKVDRIEAKLARAEKLARDAELIVVGICIGLYLAILISR